MPMFHPEDGTEFSQEELEWLSEMAHPRFHGDISFEEAERICNDLIERYVSGQPLIQASDSTPNLEALDEELTARIRNLVHTELAPIIKAEVEAEVERKLQLRFPWLKGPPGKPDKTFQQTLKSLPDWARKDE